MQFEYTEPQTLIERLFGGHYSINAFGRIESGDGDRFNNFLQRTAPPPITTVHLNTPGGSVSDGIQIGRLIRRFGLSTSVGTCILLPPQPKEVVRGREFKRGVCASSGTLTFLGGRFRFFPEGSEFRVHRFFFQSAVDDLIGTTQQTSAAIARYLVDMGIDLRFMEISASVHHAGTRSLNSEELTDLGVLASGVSEVTWSAEARNNCFYVRARRDTIYGEQKMILGHMRDGGYYIHAVFECQGRDHELTAFPLVEITMKNEVVKWDVSNRAVRQIMNGFMNVLVMLVDDEVRQLVESGSFGLKIRFSSLSDMFYGIGDMPIDDKGRIMLDTLVSMFT